MRLVAAFEKFQAGRRGDESIFGDGLANTNPAGLPLKAGGKAVFFGLVRQRTISQF
jgi:hypothetical protein